MSAGNSAVGAGVTAGARSPGSEERQGAPRDDQPKAFFLRWLDEWKHNNEGRKS